MLGTQVVTSTAVEVSPFGSAAAPLVVSGPATLGRLTLTQAGQDAEIGGNVSVIGTTGGDEVITVRGGVVIFDASFNAGGDMIVLPGSSGSYNGNLSGSSAVLNNGVANVSIPVGSNGTVVMFDDRSAILRFDSVLSKVVLGDFVLSSKASPVVLGAAPAVSSFVAEGMIDALSEFHVGSYAHTSSVVDHMTTSGGLSFA